MVSAKKARQLALEDNVGRLASKRGGSSRRVDDIVGQLGLDRILANTTAVLRDLPRGAAPAMPSHPLLSTGLGVSRRVEPGFLAGSSGYLTANSTRSGTASGGLSMPGADASQRSPSALGGNSSARLDSPASPTMEHALWFTRRDVAAIDKALQNARVAMRNHRKALKQMAQASQQGAPQGSAPSQSTSGDVTRLADAQARAREARRSSAGSARTSEPSDAEALQSGGEGGADDDVSGAVHIQLELHTLQEEEGEQSCESLSYGEGSGAREAARSNASEQERETVEGQPRRTLQKSATRVDIRMRPGMEAPSVTVEDVPLAVEGRDDDGAANAKDAAASTEATATEGVDDSTQDPLEAQGDHLDAEGADDGDLPDAESGVDAEALESALTRAVQDAGHEGTVKVEIDQHGRTLLRLKTDKFSTAIMLPGSVQPKRSETMRRRGDVVIEQDDAAAEAPADSLGEGTAQDEPHADEVTQSDMQAGEAEALAGVEGAGGDAERSEAGSGSSTRDDTGAELEAAARHSSGSAEHASQDASAAGVVEDVSKDAVITPEATQSIASASRTTGDQQHQDEVGSESAQARRSTGSDVESQLTSAAAQHTLRQFMSSTAERNAASQALLDKASELAERMAKMQDRMREQLDVLDALAALRPPSQVTATRRVDATSQDAEAERLRSAAEFQEHPDTARDGGSVSPAGGASGITEEAATPPRSEADATEDAADQPVDTAVSAASECAESRENTDVPLMGSIGSEVVEELQCEDPIEPQMQEAVDEAAFAVAVDREPQAENVTAETQRTGSDECDADAADAPAPDSDTLAAPVVDPKAATTGGTKPGAEPERVRSADRIQAFASGAAEQLRAAKVHLQTRTAERAAHAAFAATLEGLLPAMYESHISRALAARNTSAGPSHKPQSGADACANALRGEPADPSLARALLLHTALYSARRGHPELLPMWGECREVSLNDLPTVHSEHGSIAPATTADAADVSCTLERLMNAQKRTQRRGRDPGTETSARVRGLGSMQLCREDATLHRLRGRANVAQVHAWKPRHTLVTPSDEAKSTKRRPSPQTRSFSTMARGSSPATVFLGPNSARIKVPLEVGALTDTLLATYHPSAAATVTMTQRTNSPQRPSSTVLYSLSSRPGTLSANASQRPHSPSVGGSAGSRASSRSLHRPGSALNGHFPAASLSQSAVTTAGQQTELTETRLRKPSAGTDRQARQGHRGTSTERATGSGCSTSSRGMRSLSSPPERTAQSKTARRVLMDGSLKYGDGVHNERERRRDEDSRGKYRAEKQLERLLRKGLSRDLAASALIELAVDQLVWEVNTQALPGSRRVDDV